MLCGATLAAIEGGHDVECGCVLEFPLIGLLDVHWLVELGHEAGDALLKEVAACLQGCVRGGDTVARLGGDEFAVVLADVAHVDDVARVAHKILHSVAKPFQIAGKELFVTASIGIT